MQTAIAIKPLSINEAWIGKLRKTTKHLKYRCDLLFLLPNNLILPTSPPYEIYLEFGFSSSLSDFDNPIKPFVDALAEKYKFNDKLIKRAVIEIVDNVQKGKEYIAFELKTKKPR